MPASGLADFCRKHRAALLLTALGLALRLFMLGSRSLWFDEAATLYLSRSPLAQLIPAVAALEENPPLHYLLMHFWTFFFADPVLGLRLFSALCGTAALLLFILFCEKTAPEESRFAGCLGACSSFWIHFSQDGRIYALLLLLALAEGVLLFSLKKRWRTIPALAYAALAVAGLYTHNFFVFVLLAHLVDLALFYRGRYGEAPAVRKSVRPAPAELPIPQVRPWLVLYGAVLVLYSPWLLHLRSQVRLLSTASVLQQTLSLRQLGTLTGTMLFDTSFLSFAHEPWTLALGFSGLALASAGLFLMRDRLQADDLAVFCLVQWAVPLAALRLAEFLVHRALTQARYLIFISPFLYLWLALTVSRLGRRTGAVGKAVLAAVILAGSLGYAAGGRFVDPRLQGLSERIRQDPDKRDPVVYLDPFYYLPMRHYYLPERAHYLVGPRSDIANWDAMPGYKPYLADRALLRLKRCVVIDPRHLMFDQRVGLASGRQVLQSVSSPGRSR